MTNWKELGTPFQDFNEESTQRWIENDLTFEQAKEWLELGFNYRHYHFLSWLRDEKKIINFNDWKELNNDFKQNLVNQFNQYWKEKNLASCGWCWKAMEEKLMFFRNREKDEDFCSENCQTKWNNYISQAQNYLDYWYPKNGVCLRKNEYSSLNNFGKRRSEITRLNLSKQKLTGTLDLSDFVNLEELDCYDNYSFPFSLLNLQKLTKLKKLNISRTSISIDLRYLPVSLEHFSCFGTRLEEELKLYNRNLITWQAAHQYLMKEVGREIVEIDYAKSQLIITITKHWSLNENNDLKLNPNDDLTNLSYDNFFLRDQRPFSWEDNSPEIRTSREKQLGNEVNNILPLRLYNLATNQVIESKQLPNNTNYLVLSYCWGADWENTPQSYGQDYKTKLTKLGRKALNKVKDFYQNHKNKEISSHIWVDNFCINQFDRNEKGSEVKSQKNYYSNAVATLVNINAEIGNQIDKDNELELAYHILELITESDWFTRSWTFQEGILSKQTIFMFDDYLVDGRVLAQYWGSLQRNQELECGIGIKHNPIIHITPLGWSYGARTSKSISLNLGQALLAVSHRSQTIAIDGIYSILGLLPYGEKIVTNYKENNDYSVAELETALQEVVKAACQNDCHVDLFSWYGPRNNNLVPTVKQNGTPNVKEIIRHQEMEKIKAKVSMINDEFIHLTKVKSFIVESWKNERYYIELQTADHRNIRIDIDNPGADLIIEKGDTLIIIVFNSLSFFDFDFSLTSLFIPTKHQHPICLCKVSPGFIHNDEHSLLVDLKTRKIIKDETGITNYLAKTTSQYTMMIENA